MTKGLQRTHVTSWASLLVLVGLGTVLLLSESRIKTAIAQAPPTPLNIIVIKTDDQRWDTLWAMPMVQQELVRRGVNFVNAFVSTPLCCPERASFLAGGLYAHNTGVLANRYPNGGASKFLDIATLPVRLQRVGYKTAMLGKYLNQYGSLRGPLGGPYIPPGWTKFVQTIGGNDLNAMRYRPVVGSSGPEAPSDGAYIQVEQYLTDFLRDEAVKFMQEAASSPFFIYLAPFAPHLPVVAAPGDETLFADYRYRGRGYQEDDLSDKPYLLDDAAIYDPVVQDEANRQQLRALQAVDRAVGTIVQELKTLGKLHTTLLVFMSDNGYLWGEHWQSNKGLAYEESIRVPLVVVMPGIHPRQDSHLVVANLDVPATILEMTGILGTYTDGRSLVPLLRNPQIEWRTEFLIEYYPSKLWQTILDPSMLLYTLWAGIRTNDYKYVEWDSGHKVLFDLVRDTYELQNEIDNPAYQPIVQELAEKLESLKGLAIIGTAPSEGKVGHDFSLQLAAWGGAKPYAWAAVRGRLPPGLRLDRTTGLLAGTPTRAGRYPTAIQVSDASESPYSQQPQVHTRPFTFVINP